VLRTYRLSPDIAGFQIDDTAAETDTAHTPTIDLPAFLMSYGSGNQFLVDWIRIRQYCGAETSTAVGSEQAVGPTAVTLVSFTAVAGRGAIILTWETATELDNLGFNLYRSEALDGDYVRLNQSLISGQHPGSPEGAVYTWQDVDVSPGVAYYYKLEDLDLHGGRRFHGPVWATARIEGAYLIHVPLVIKP
jgi:hypothetical protein